MFQIVNNWVSIQVRKWGKTNGRELGKETERENEREEINSFLLTYGSLQKKNESINTSKTDALFPVKLKPPESSALSKINAAFT